jgi:hypothetical protein
MTTTPRYARAAEVPRTPTLDADFNEARDKLDAARIEYTQAGGKLSQVEAEIRRADANYATEAAEAVKAGKAAPKDPREAAGKRRERLVVERQVAAEVLNSYANDLDAVVERDRESWSEQERGRRKSMYEQAATLLDQVEGLLLEAQEVGVLLDWLATGRGKAKLVGGRALADLRADLDEAANPTPTYYVRKAERDKLADGHNATDAVTGERITPEQAERAFSKGKLKIVHGVPQRVVGPEYE